MEMENRVHNLIKEGVYDPHVLFKTVYAEFPVHYSKVREAIHAAKTK